jgi:dUTP pyrophosphatase
MGANMERVAKFEKVSFEQFVSAYNNAFPSMTREDIAGCYDAVSLPLRATAFSAGYDFRSPFEFELNPGESITVPTGIRAAISPGWALFVYPRSGLGFKFRLQLNNTVGVIDGDYYFADNEGHIMIKIMNDSREQKTVRITTGDAFAQGVFMQYGITEDDCADAKRSGGFGSTGH